jgi:hypothetical protein
MPIRPAFRALYPKNWRALSQRVRFERAGGRCQGCHRPHLAWVRCLPDGRWFDEAARTWRDRRGRPARWPDLIETANLRLTRVVLAAAHLDNNPANNRLANLRGFCQRCHMLHDRPFHLAQRWLTYRRRWASADLFLGPYGAQPPLAVLLATAGQTGLSAGRAHVGRNIPPIGGRVGGDRFPPRANGRGSLAGSAEDLFKPAR